MVLFPADTFEDWVGVWKRAQLEFWRLDSYEGLHASVMDTETYCIELVSGQYLLRQLPLLGVCFPFDVALPPWAFIFEHRVVSLTPQSDATGGLQSSHDGQRYGEEHKGRKAVAIRGWLLYLTVDQSRHNEAN